MYKSATLLVALLLMNQQALLLVPTNHSSVSFQNMRLDVNQMEQGCVGLLEINSNKFYVEFIVNEEGVICEFQIFGAKGYFEFSIKIIKIIRNIVQNLYALH